MSLATLNALAEAHLDITGAAHVEVVTKADKSVLWINVNGVCVLRVCRIQLLDELTRVT